MSARAEQKNYHLATAARKPQPLADDPRIPLAGQTRSVSGGTMRRDELADSIGWYALKSLYKYLSAEEWDGSRPSPMDAMTPPDPSPARVPVPSGAEREAVL